jgi:iron complex outermembrane receptor protein
MTLAGRPFELAAGTASAPGYGVAALFARYLKRWDRWEFNNFARVDNHFDKQYIGSVIVNEGNAHCFEPAPRRNWTVGAIALVGSEGSRATA